LKFDQQVTIVVTRAHKSGIALSDIAKITGLSVAKVSAIIRRQE